MPKRNLNFISTILMFVLLQSGACYQLKGQADSIRFKMAGLALDWQFILSNEQSKSASVERLQELVKNDGILNTSFPDSKIWSGERLAKKYLYSTASIGFKVFFDHRLGDWPIEIYTGCRLGFRPELLHSRSYIMEDTVAIVHDPGTNETVMFMKGEFRSYSYLISSSNLLIPLGINFVTDKNKLTWFSAGIEITPGISFAYSYRAHYEMEKGEYEYKNPENSQFSAISRQSYKTTYSESASSYRRVQGIGFNGYISFPLAMNMSVSKNKLKNLKLTVTLAPGYYLISNRLNTNHYGPIINCTGGVRYNIR